MTAHSWEQLRALFDELVDLSPTQRQAQIARRRLEPPLAEELWSLLRANDEPGLLDDPVGLVAASRAPRDDEALPAGTRIGHFSIDQRIGRGGMGDVYAAHRIDGPFEQAVALKLLRPEASARADLFDRERRVLAGLEHPGIARLIDGGITTDQRPYMAMEFVDGRPIDVWCREHAADLSTRLGLFREICDAVGYAHARLVIHRDLKPSNILVDERGRIRLLDFGVAGLIDDAAMTDVAIEAIVTPDYAAPEQLASEGTTVATDIYALGVILYQLLADQTPWGANERSIPSLIRRVMHDDPDPPSKAAGRGGGAIRPARIAGDLDAIVLKAIRKVPAERYRSAAELGDDVARHQRLQPVQARAGSTRYVIGRFAQRYRWAVGASVAAVLALLIGAGGIAWQARQTAIERDVARAEARRSEAINRLLTVMVRDTRESGGGLEVTVKQMLDATAKRLVASVDTSAKSATLITTVSDLYVNLEDAASADTLLREALEKGVGRDDPVATAEIKFRLASSSVAMNRPGDVTPLLDAAEAVFRTDPDRFRYEQVEIASARAQLARRQGDQGKAIALLTNILPQAEVAYAENHRDLLTIYNNLLVYMVEANRLDDMPAVFERVDEVLKRTQQQDTMQGLSLRQLKGVRLFKLGQAAQAEPIFARIAAQRRAVFGKSAGLAVDLLQLGRAQLAQGKFAEAQRVLGEARPIATENLGPAAVPTLTIGLGLAEAMAETGDIAGAERTLGEVEPRVLAIAKPGIVHGLLARTRAVVRLRQGKIAAARVEADRSQAIFTALGPAGAFYLKALPVLRARIDRAG
jgi:non-specific serine/threonine protein kinase/serine/threonine-protein kinase